MDIGDLVEVIGPVGSSQVGMTGKVQSIQPFVHSNKKKKIPLPVVEDTLVVVTLDQIDDKRLKNKNFYGSNLKVKG